MRTNTTTRRTTNKESESNQAYREKPTEDSVGCIFGTRKIRTDRGTLTVISTTIRSGRYGKEWVSNVTLGKSGEAKGFSDAAWIIF